MTASEQPLPRYAEVVGHRHFRFTRTVARTVQGRGAKIDLVLEGHFAIGFRPEDYVLDLIDKGNGVVTVELMPKPGIPTPAIVEALHVGANAVGIGAVVTETEVVALDEIWDVATSDERVEEILGELLTPASQTVGPPAGRRALLGAAALSPLLRF